MSASSFINFEIIFFLATLGNFGIWGIVFCDGRKRGLNEVPMKWMQLGIDSVHSCRMGGGLGYLDKTTLKMSPLLKYNLTCAQPNNYHSILPI